MSAKQSGAYQGLLAIGDPHLEGRVPGFRKDDYPQVILDKLQWALDYASQHHLLPMLLGDLFDKPRDNPTWLLGRLIEMLLPREVIGIFGNHDCAETTLNEHDSLSILMKSGSLTLVSEEAPWVGEIHGRPVMVGGSSYRSPIPRSVSLPNTSRSAGEPFVVWLTHHDVALPEYGDAGRFAPFEIENVDVLINGHIHRRMDPVTKGKTLWLNPGNISRRSRSEANFVHVPRLLRIDVPQESGYQLSDVEVPHRAADEVFYETVPDPIDPQSNSSFVAGLKELQTRKTDSGAGLHAFLEKNLTSFPAPISEEIRSLANQVTQRDPLHVEE